MNNEKARWLISSYHPYTVTCSRCKYVVGNFHAYCPNCGTEMENGKKVETKISFDNRPPKQDIWK